MTDSPKTHSLVKVSVASPRLCNVCEDYIITPKRSAYQCFSCSRLFHNICGQRALRLQDSCPGFQKQTTPDGDSALYYIAFSQKETFVSISEQPLSNWSCEQVLQWLAVVGISRYIQLFLICNINGGKLSFLLNPPTPIDDIPDPFARRTLKRAVMTLLGELQTPGDRIAQPTETNSTEQNSPHKNMHLANFTTEFNCCVCGLVLLGIIWQGYQCSDCGFVFHRMCRVFTEEHPPCNPLSCLPSIVDTVSEAALENDLSQTEHKLPNSSPSIRHRYLGVPLEMQECNSSEVPVFLAACTQQFEKLAIVDDGPDPKSCHHMVDCSRVYTKSATGKELQLLAMSYVDRLPSDPVELTDATSSSASPEQKVVRIAQLMKHFLRELPEPVIPSDLYHKTLALVTPGSSSFQQSTALQALLTSLPPRNFATLRHVMYHLGFILCHQRLLKLRLMKSPVGRTMVGIDKLDNLCILFHIFGQILLRPAWSDILCLANTCSNEVHLSVVELVFEHLVRSPGSIGDVSRSLAASRPMARYEFYSELLCHSGGTLQTPGSTAPPTAKSTARNRADLEERDWYWGDIPKVELIDVMEGQPEGAFLVRDASRGSVSSFTIIQRQNFSNILFRIYHRGDSFGLQNPPAPGFPLVSELIAYYMEQTNVSPSVANRTTSTTIMPSLKLPVSRFHYRFQLAKKPGVSRPLSAADLETPQLLDALKKKFSEVAEHKAAIDRLNHDSSVYLQMMGTRSMMLRGLTKTNDWLKASKSRFLYNASVQASPSAASNVQGKTMVVLMKQYQEVLDNRISRAKQRIREEKNQHDCLLDCTREVSEQQVVHMARQLVLSRQTQEIRRELKHRNVGHDVIFACTPTDPDTPPASLVPTIGQPTIDYYGRKGDGSGGGVISQRRLAATRPNKATWFVENISRQQAEDILSGMPKGAFLIRPSAIPQRFALSVKAGTGVHHCLVYCVNNMYGVHESCCEFKSLEDLVTFYRFNSLVKHNALLDTTLSYPAFATEAPHSSS